MLLQGNGTGFGADNAVEGLGFYIVLGLFIALALYGLHRVRAQRRKGRPPVGLWAVLLVVWLLPALPEAGASGPFGVHALGVAPSGSVAVPEGGPWTVCVRLPSGSGDVTVRIDDGGASSFVLFTMNDGLGCKRVAGGGLWSLESGDEARLLVLRDPPRVPSAPGVLRVEAEGSAVAVPGLGPDAQLGLLVSVVGTTVQVVDRATLVAYVEVEGARERTLRAPEDVPLDRPLYVIVSENVAGGDVSVRWEDPDWYRRTPTLGHVGVALAAALFLTLYRGRVWRPLSH